TLLAVVLFLAGAVANADPIVGSIFMTGHDPDFHAFVGGNTAGAAHLNNAAINFITDPTFNTFAAGGIHKFLYVTSNISPPGGHIDGTLGIVASGYVQGTDFDKADASTLVSALGQLGTTYDALVVASDFGGILTQAELDILNAHSADIISFLNQGGGVYAIAESNSQAQLTPNGGHFGFLPFIVSSAQKNQSEVGNTLTSFGAGLGLTVNDINGNASHNIFTGPAGLNVVDFDSSGQILTLAGRGQVTQHGIVPEPSSIILLGTTMLAVALFSRRLSTARSQS
ncbi:MAG: putative Ig protein, partial [Bryobacterales bacterium]|nr:putative Ig protein [Bryobacterales bacterium]